ENKSRYVKVKQVDDGVDEEVGEDRAFQMSAFRRKDIFEEEEEGRRMMRVEEVEEGQEAVLAE
ncbi:MAG: hypothetical protein Q9225_003478, partial [Loekoesia sp. 1 TL-2023]